MTQLPDGGAAEERRLLLASVAARAERSNQPRHVVLLAGLVLAGAVLALVLGWSSFAAARSKLRTQQDTAGRVVETAARLQALRSAGPDTSSPRASDAGQQVLGLIERAGREAGLRDRVVAPRTRESSSPGSSAVRYEWTYDVRDPSLDAILNWIARVREQAPSLEVFSFKVRPEQQVWFVTVRFTRWERAE
ncbi:MAG: hypothetical protein SFY69_02265 [Planctomycetota bacterium]|nr:hypothetical protein [Planctomycetota bacterium]